MGQSGDQGRAPARAEQERLLPVDHDRQGERPGESGHRLADRVHRRGAGVERRVDELGHYFSVGLALEAAAGGLQLFLQRTEVLNDPVMDKRHTPGAMRMGVGLVRRAMGGPAGMSDSLAGRGQVARLVEQALNLAHRAPALD